VHQQQHVDGSRAEQIIQSCRERHRLSPGQLGGVAGAGHPEVNADRAEGLVCVGNATDACDGQPHRKRVKADSASRSASGSLPPFQQNRKPPLNWSGAVFRIGVADGTRTRDSQDHTLVLYQLNYSHHYRDVAVHEV
jgi:hypothetical protein